MKGQSALITSNVMTTVLLVLYVHFKGANPVMFLPLFLMFANILVTILTYYSQRKKLQLLYVLGKSQTQSLLEFVKIAVLSHGLTLMVMAFIFWTLGRFSILLLVVDFAYCLFLISVKELLMVMVLEKWL